MEGATRSGLMVADEVIARADGPNGLKAMAREAQAKAVVEEVVEETKEPEKSLFFATEA